MPSSIWIVRHAEKQVGDGPPYGVLADGTPDSESLTPRGWQRAGALVGLFVPRMDPSDGSSGAAPSAAAAFPTPNHMFASEVGPKSPSRRPLETLRPLSERLSLPLEAPYLQDELDRLVGAILECDGHVLVAWEHKRIPLIANRLVSDADEVPQAWPEDRFDLVWVIEHGASTDGFRLRQVPQLLLAGDSAEPIT